jgi:hypothetical protein
MKRFPKSSTIAGACSLQPKPSQSRAADGRSPAPPRESTLAFEVLAFSNDERIELADAFVSHALVAGCWDDRHGMPDGLKDSFGDMTPCERVSMAEKLTFFASLIRELAACRDPHKARQIAFDLVRGEYLSSLQ